MRKKIEKLNIIKKQIKRFFEDNFGKIIEINEKYAQPKIEATLAVKYSLILLKVYLLFIAVLLIYKFITLIK